MKIPVEFHNKNKTEILTVKITKINFQNKKSLWSAVTGEDEEGGRIYMYGTMPNIWFGAKGQATGQWVCKEKFGWQFQVSSWSELLPATDDGIRAYLKDAGIPGLGDTLVDRTVDMFGTDTFNILDNDPDKLLDVNGIGEGRLRKIKPWWLEHRGLADIITALTSCGLSSSMARKVYKTFGDQSLSIIKTDPYRMADEVDGIGFKKADEIAMQNGVRHDSPRRIQSGLLFFLKRTSEKDGDCYLYDSYLIRKANKEELQVNEELVREGLEMLVDNGKVIREEDRIFLPNLYRDEVRIAGKLAELNELPKKNYGKIIEGLDDADFELDEEQEDAVKGALEYGLYYITGGPGTGKTTITKLIIENLEHMDRSYKLCAPTGRASKRLEEATGREAKTIHRLLETDGSLTKFKHNEKNPLKCDTLIVDECSMIDIRLMDSLLRAVGDHTRLILIGDADQLPSVGPGNVLHDVIASNVVHGTRLEHIHRCSATSLITMNAKKINDGIMPDMTIYDDGDFFFKRQCDTDEETADEIVTMCSEKLPKYYDFIQRGDVQVLAPKYEGQCEVDVLNRKLQDTLNPSGDEIKCGNKIFRVGDKVMQLSNDYELGVMNGDIGFVEKTDHDHQTVTVKFDEKEVKYERIELEELSLAYAITIHKSQGSEYPAVVIPIMSDATGMWNRNLLYTGLTRAKKLCVFIGNADTLQKAVEKMGSHRNTTLDERLIASSRKEEEEHEETAVENGSTSRK